MDTKELLFGLLVAVVGGIIDNHLDRRLAALSSWYRARSATRRAGRDSAIAALAANPTLLAVAYLDTLVGMVFTAAAFALWMEIATSLGWKASSGNAVPSPTLDSGMAFSLLFVLGAFLLIAGFFVGRRLSAAQEAWNKIRRANGFPKWW